MTKDRKKSLIALAVACIVVIGGYLLMLSIFSDCKENPLGARCPEAETPLDGIPVDPENTLTETEGDAEAPVIESISPKSGPKGSLVEIRGRNLSGLEGDLEVTFESATGQKFTLFDEKSYPETGGSLIRINVKEPCQAGETVYGRYSGIPSQCNFIEMKPGVYKVYAEPWGTRSNQTIFTLTK